MPFKSGKAAAEAGRKGAKARSNNTAAKYKSLTDTQRKALASKAEGLTPLEFAASILRDENEPLTRRMWACDLLMPYMHRKLPTAVEGAFVAGSMEEMKRVIPSLLIDFVGTEDGGEAKIIDED